jgi:hypothetical protein
MDQIPTIVSVLLCSCIIIWLSNHFPSSDRLHFGTPALNEHILLGVYRLAFLVKVESHKPVFRRHFLTL